MAALLADVHRHPHAFVTVVFDVLDLAPADGDALAEPFAHFGLGSARSLGLGVIEHGLGDLPELIEAVGELAVWHGKIGLSPRGFRGRFVWRACGLV